MTSIDKMMKDGTAMHMSKRERLGDSDPAKQHFLKFQYLIPMDVL